jgi:hypothetical protein
MFRGGGSSCATAGRQGRAMSANATRYSIRNAAPQLAVIQAT